MNKTLFTLLTLALLLISITGSALAAGPSEFTIDVRNHTGAPVEFNYTGADGVHHTTTIPAGVTSLTLMEGVYNFWADPSCGHVAGSININQQRQILMIDCGAAQTVGLGYIKPKSGVVFYQCLNGGSGPYEYNFYDWNDNYDDWGVYGTFCYAVAPTDGDGEFSNIWGDGETYWYQYMSSGINSGPYGNCPGWSDFGPAFYYLGMIDPSDPTTKYLDCP